MTSSVPGSSNAHLSVRFADKDIIHFPSPHPPSPQLPQKSPALVRDRSEGLVVNGSSSGFASFSRPPRRGRVISKAELLHHLASSDIDGAAAADTSDSHAESANAILASNASNRGGGFNTIEQQLQQLVVAPKYQPTNNIPPQVDTRGGRVARMTIDNVSREAAAAAVAAATAAAAAAADAAAGGIDKPNVVGKSPTVAVSTLRRRNAASERMRSKQASVCAILLVFLLLIIPITMVVGTVTHLSSGCRIWLDSPILLLVIGLCSTLIAVMAPLFLFRLMGVRCLEDLISICAITVITLALGAIIFALLLVITGAMLFHPEEPEQLRLCSLFIKKFITACVAVLWFFIAALLLLFCCDAIMS